MNEAELPPPPTPGSAESQPADAAAQALAEAELRRRGQVGSPGPVEIGGRTGPDPIRYGDWENKGIASDF